MQFEAWLSHYPHLKKQAISKIKNYVKHTKNIADKKIRCISCGKKGASLCPYCFTNHVLDILKDLKINKMILKEFLQFFNYDFGHTRYAGY
jgi:hypothetical protein